MDCCIPDPTQKQSRSTPTSGCLKTSTLVLQGDWPLSEMSEMDKATLSPMEVGNGYIWKVTTIGGTHFWLPWLWIKSIWRLYHPNCIKMRKSTQPFHSLKKFPFRLFRYASKIAVANNYNKECRVLIENGDKDGLVPPDTIVEPCQISWLAIFASEFLLSKQGFVLVIGMCFFSSSCCNMKHQKIILLVWSALL